MLRDDRPNPDLRPLFRLVTASQRARTTVVCCHGSRCGRLLWDCGSVSSDRHRGQHDRARPEDLAEASGLVAGRVRRAGGGHQLVGDLKNAGREWRPQGEPEAVRVHDFLIKELGRAVPYGIYDLGANAGWASVGMNQCRYEPRHRGIRRTDDPPLVGRTSAAGATQAPSA
jgi:hypothetical protein